jgi:hypothetical protein
MHLPYFYHARLSFIPHAQCYFLAFLLFFLLTGARLTNGFVHAQFVTVKYATEKDTTEKKTRKICMGYRVIARRLD